MQRPCRIVTRESGNVGIIMVRGRLDPTGPQDPLESAVSAMVEAGKTNILMDLRSVSYISSTGIGSIRKEPPPMAANAGRYILKVVPTPGSL